MEILKNMKIRKYGNEGPTVFVLHGGPGAMGSAEPLALGLSDAFTVIEPWQRGSGGRDPLTVSRHVADLHEIVQNNRGVQLPTIVGESWGAMLALAYAAEHANDAGPIVLVGCGTFDKESRAVSTKIREKRIADYIAEHPEHDRDLYLNLDDRIMKWHYMTDNYEPVPGTLHTEHELFDAKAYSETWEDMIRCQEIGLYPEAFSRIVSPVIMLHGAYDPHPGKMIRDNLKPHVPQIEYREFDRCGHQPFIERFAKK